MARRRPDPPFQAGVTATELDVAVDAARQAGRIALDHRTRGVEVTYKAAGDLVTAADHDAQARITAILNEAFPADAVVGEEGSPPPEEAVAGRRRWYVDPVDGTTNFLKGRLWWGVSIGFCDERDRLTAGVVYLPSLDLLYTAAEGRGARCNGRTVRCSAVTDLSEALCVSGFPGAASMAATSRRNLEIWGRVMPHTQSLRANGAVAPDWCSVASGQSDASWALAVGRWDIAAATVVAREAGAVVTDLDGVPIRGPATAGLAAAPGIHGDLLELISG